MRSKICGLAIGSLCLIVAACSGGADADNVTHVSSFEEPIESLEQVDQRVDALVHVRLLDVVDGYRFPVDEEWATASGEGAENVGLVFEVLDTYLGAVDRKQITVDWAGYIVDLETGKRLSRKIVNNIDLADGNRVGDEFVVGVKWIDGIGYRVWSTSAFLSVDDGGALTSFDLSFHDVLGIDSALDLRSEADRLPKSRETPTVED